jgi:hypothetical protein
MRFNLSSLPASSVISSANLHLFYDDNQLGGGSNQAITIHSVAAANGNWVAGTKDIALAGAGESCWNAKAADGSGGVTTAWAGSEGCATETTDYESTVIGSFTALAADPQGTEYIVSLNTTRVQGWCGASNTNYGIILFCPGWGGHHFAKAARAETNWRPKLVVEYTAGSRPVFHRKNYTWKRGF